MHIVQSRPRSLLEEDRHLSAQRQGLHNQVVARAAKRTQVLEYGRYEEDDETNHGVRGAVRSHPSQGGSDRCGPVRSPRNSLMLWADEF